MTRQSGLKFGLGGMLVYLLLLISCNSNRGPVPDRHDEGVTYKQLEEIVFDRGHMTKITTSLLLEDGITKPNIEALLHKLYRKTAARSGFQYHPHPTDIVIFAFLTKEHFTSGMGQWVAMLEKTPEESEPVMRFDEVQLAQIREPPVMRFGLSDSLRREVFRDVMRERNLQQGATGDTTQSRDSISAKYNISRADLDTVVVEGLRKHWAFPIMPQSW